MAFFKKKESTNTCIIYAPANGTVIPLEQVPDPVFSNKLMGDGIAIDIDDDVVYAPADGKITLIAKSKHAFGMVLDNGLELMVHVGLESVQLQGEGFQALVNEQDCVKVGTPILKIDRSLMQERHISLLTPIIVLNHKEHPIEFLQTSDYITMKQPLFHSHS